MSESLNDSICACVILIIFLGAKAGQSPIWFSPGETFAGRCDRACRALSIHCGNPRAGSPLTQLSNWQKGAAPHHAPSSVPPVRGCPGNRLLWNCSQKYLEGRFLNRRNPANEVELLSSRRTLLQNAGNRPSRVPDKKLRVWIQKNPTRQIESQSGKRGSRPKQPKAG